MMGVSVSILGVIVILFGMSSALSKILKELVKLNLIAEKIASQQAKSNNLK
jgi:hypothetical protein